MSSEASTSAAQVCSTSFARVTVEDLTPAGGEFSVAIHLTNDSRQACTVYGYPGVAVLNVDGHQRYQATRTPTGFAGGLHSGQRAQHITLQPGETATAILEGGIHQEPSGTLCPEDHSILITPPNTTTTVRRAAQVYVCRAPDIHPMIAGQSG